MSLEARINFEEREVCNIHADYLFSHHSLETYLARHGREICSYAEQHGKVDVDRYWIEPLSVMEAPVGAYREKHERITMYEVQLQTSGPDFLWFMSPTFLQDLIPFGEHPTTWHCRLGSNPMMPKGKLRDGAISLFGYSEDELERSIIVLNHVVDLIRTRLNYHMEQLELYWGSQRFAKSGITPKIF